jgi:gas vesicle protein
MSKNSDLGKKLAVGALVAGAVGYVAGILTAPKSGKESRQDITDKAKDIHSQAVSELKALHDELSDLINRAKDNTIALSASARSEFNEALIRAKDARQKAALLLKAIKSGDAEDPELEKAIKQAKQAQKNLTKFIKK